MLVLASSGDGYPLRGEVQARPPYNNLPQVPIPTNDFRYENATRLEWSPFGSTLGVAELRGKTMAENSVGRFGGFRTLSRFRQTDSTVTLIATHWNPSRTRIIGVGVEHIFYLANSWCAAFRIESVSGRLRMNLRFSYYLVDGVAFGLSLDSRSGMVWHTDYLFDSDDWGMAAIAWFLRIRCLFDPLLEAAGRLASQVHHFSAK
jgi:hypothetical protein